MAENEQALEPGSDLPEQKVEKVKKIKKKKQKQTPYDTAMKNLYWILIAVMFGVVLWLGFEAALIIKAELEHEGMLGQIAPEVAVTELIS